MEVKDFYYELPQELIAQDPLEDRSSSRLLVMQRESGALTPYPILPDPRLPAVWGLPGTQ